MKPIRIDNDLLQFAQNFSSELFADKEGGFIKPQKGLNKLKSGMPIKADRQKCDFIDKLICDLPRLLTLLPHEQSEYITNVETNFKGLFSDKEGKHFSKQIVEALRYETLRKDYGYKIVEKLKIKTCPYCNAMLTVNIPKNNSTKAKYQLDHYFPKSHYPYLSISFFNLIPCCANCNHSKTNNKPALGKDFHLYANETPDNPFIFKLDKNSLLNKLTSTKADDIEIRFTPSSDSTSEMTENHNKNFNIKEIYNTQKDVAEEMIWKTQAYPPEKIKELEQLLNSSHTEVKRMVVGNYTNSEDIHKRPFAKFMQDIAKDLNFDQKEPS